MSRFAIAGVVALLIGAAQVGTVRAQGCSGGGYQFAQPSAFNYAPQAPSYYYAPPAAPQFYGGPYGELPGYCYGGYCPQPAYAPPVQRYYPSEPWAYGGNPYAGYGVPRYRGIGVVGFRSR